MVRITAAAEAQIAALENHYAALGRDAAVLRLAEAVEIAALRIEEDAGPFLPAPRPYPHLAAYGWSWLRQGRYWVAFVPEAEGHAIVAVFYDTADIPRRF